MELNGSLCKLTALDALVLINGELAEVSGVASCRYQSLVTLAALGVSLSLQHSKLGVRQNRAELKKLLPISVTVTTLLLG